MPTTAFISYAWNSAGEDNEAWVQTLAARLRQDGIDIKLDKWEVQPGDSIAQFMERAIYDNDKVLIICTPVYKAKAEARSGAAGYETRIISSLILQSADQRKFIPVLRSGTVNTAVPLMLQDKYIIQLHNGRYEEEYAKLLAALHNRWETAPPLGHEHTITNYGNLSFAQLNTLSKTELKSWQKYYREKLKAYPHNGQGYFGMGMMALQNGMYEMATNYFEKAADLNPANADYQFYHAMSTLVVAKKQGYPYALLQLAAHALEQAIALDSSQGKYFCLLELLHTLTKLQPGKFGLANWSDLNQQVTQSFNDRFEVQRINAIFPN